MLAGAFVGMLFSLEHAQTAYRESEGLLCFFELLRGMAVGALAGSIGASLLSRLEGQSENPPSPNNGGVEQVDVVGKDKLP
jgi:ABC-type uncharacterized transport system permease subunit